MKKDPDAESRCPHGSLRRKCETCDLLDDNDALRAAWIAAMDRADSAEAQCDRAKAVLRQWIALCEGQTEPIPPVAWAVELRASHQAIEEPFWRRP